MERVLEKTQDSCIDPVHPFSNPCFLGSHAPGSDSSVLQIRKGFACKMQILKRLSFFSASQWNSSHFTVWSLWAEDKPPLNLFLLFCVRSFISFSFIIPAEGKYTVLQQKQTIIK